MLQIKDAQTRVNLIFAQPEAARTILETAKGKVKRNPISWIPSFPQIDFIVLFNRFNFKYHTMASYIGLLKKRKNSLRNVILTALLVTSKYFLIPFRRINVILLTKLITPSSKRHSKSKQNDWSLTLSTLHTSSFKVCWNRLSLLRYCNIGLHSNGLEKRQCCEIF